MPRILVLTPDVIKQRLAGPAIRAWEMASELGKSHEVRLLSVTQVPVERTHHHFFVSNEYRVRGLRQHLSWADVVIVQGTITTQYPVILRMARFLVVDLYDPMHIELLEQTEGELLEKRQPKLTGVTDTLNAQIDRADFILCASEKQRDFWLGQLAARGRLNAYTYEASNQLKLLLAVAPFGLPSSPPEKDYPAIKGVLDGIAKGDEVILWGGGLYNWFDPLTLIRAMALVKNIRPQVKLFFMGSGHPNPHVPQMAIAGQASQLAAELGLLNNTVFFNDEWVAYEERSQYLLDADLGVSTHAVHLETEFSFRTRILDYLWAGLPMVVSEGDSFAELVNKRELGRVVGEGNVEELANSIVELLSNPALLATTRARVRAVAREFQWSTVLAPLVTYCANPYEAPDRLMMRRRPPLWRAFASSARHSRWGWPVIFLYRVRSKIRQVFRRDP